MRKTEDGQQSKWTMFKTSLGSVVRVERDWMENKTVYWKLHGPENEKCLTLEEVALLKLKGEL